MDFFFILYTRKIFRQYDNLSRIHHFITLPDSESLFTSTLLDSKSLFTSTLPDLESL